MKIHPFLALMCAALCLISMIFIAACSGRVTTPPAGLTITASPTEDLGGLSADHAATLRSLEKVDDYPLYVMHYSGSYIRSQAGLGSPPEEGIACSLFAALAPGSDMFYGRNFDWDFSPALLLFMDPPDGYASVSMVDLTFLGISPDEAASLTDLPLAKRTALLDAPAMPFDGLNEYGLAVAMAAVPEAGAVQDDSSKPIIGSIGIIREVLDHARNVDEAVALFKKYNIHFAGGPPIHYLVADRSGKAVLVEMIEGELVVLPNESPWHLATNHLRATASGDGGCLRYHLLSETLTSDKGQLDEKTAMQLLSNVAQSGTQWSVIYNLTRGDISVAIGQKYDPVYTFHLEPARP
jgi:hypothetical protein